MTAMTIDAPPGRDDSPQPAVAESAASAGPKRSIVAKQALFVGFLLALTSTALTTAGYLYVGDMITEQIDARLSAIADDRQSLLLAGLRREGDRVVQAANRTRLRILLDSRSRASAYGDGPAIDLQGALDDVRESSREFQALRLEALDGETLAVSGEEQDVAAIPQGLREPRTGGTPRTAVPVENGDSRAAVFAADVLSRSGTLMGRLFALVDLSRIDAQLADPRWLGQTGEVLIGRREGDVVQLLFPPRQNPELRQFPVEKTAGIREAVAGHTGLVRALDRFGREVLAAYRPLGYADWGVVVKIDAGEAYAPVRRLRRLLTAIGSTILLAGLAAAYFLARQQARPIKRLAEAAEAVADGRLNTPIAVTSNDEIGVLESSFARMTGQLARSHADLEGRIHERTRDLEEVRDLLDAFFRISTSQADSQTLDRTFDSVLAFCSRLGYELAMISLVDREAGVVRGVRGGGAMGEIVAETIRPLNGDDILARVVRDGNVEIVPDSTVDPACDHEAVARAELRGQIVLPLASGDEVLGTLQVAVREPLDPAQVDLRPLETLASHAGRTLGRFQQIAEVRRLNESLDHRAEELARSEAAFREQAQILRSVLDCMGEGVIVSDGDFELMVMNPAARRILDLPADAGTEVVWATASRVYPIGAREPYRVDDLPLRRAIRGEPVDQVEMMLGRPSIQEGRCLSVDARPLVDELGVTRGGLVVFQEITARKRGELRLTVEYTAARVLAESESVAEAAPRILRAMAEQLEWELAVLWRIDSASGQARCLTFWRDPKAVGDGLNDAIRDRTFRSGESIAGRVWADRKAAWIADLASTDQGEGGCELCRMLVDGGFRSAFGAPVMLRGDCIGVLGFFSAAARVEDPDLLDMTGILGAQIGQFQDRCQMHSRVVQSEKLASLGMLSASVAHEINNPLAYVASNLAVLDRDARALLEVLADFESCSDVIEAERPELAAEIRRLDEEYDLTYVKENLGKVLDSTRQGVRRVADIVHNLRGFARGDRGSAGPGSVDLHESIAAALEMIRGRLDRRGIRVEDHSACLPPVAASAAQLNQVFLNLLVNAMQAIDAAQRADGVIAIDGVVKGDDVRLEIRDNGCGMSPDVLAQIFDPFFTTKSAGEGTGLGLSISHGIVLDHGGRIEVESTPGEGTCFRIVLPISRKIES
ncbi:ATP-binding protein [Paludisphaera rhizosphaerae]|uniref:ATP-binding protein n=1 Tax=Paludisphaera rhizosphaerae TaxID=2711216 RepID=UPI0013ECA639|nr:ATP-binding protein [Paludisphaera rhizosphaerae]